MTWALFNTNIAPNCTIFSEVDPSSWRENACGLGRAVKTFIKIQAEKSGDWFREEQKWGSIKCSLIPSLCRLNTSDISEQIFPSFSSPCCCKWCWVNSPVCWDAPWREPFGLKSEMNLLSWSKSKSVGGEEDPLKFGLDWCWDGARLALAWLRGMKCSNQCYFHY